MLRQLTVIFCALLLCALGCQEKKQPVQFADSWSDVQVSRQPPAQKLRIVVPEDVQGKWQSVNIAVRDFETGSEEFHIVAVGESFKLVGTELKVTVDHFLPAFIMDGKQITSSSNLATNPAAHILIHEQDELIYSGWLFALYPDTHAFQHPRFNLTLVGYEPSS